MVGGQGLVGYSAAADLQLAGTLLMDRDVIQGLIGYSSGEGGGFKVGEDDELLLQGLDEGAGRCVVEVAGQEEGLASGLGHLLDELQGGHPVGLG